MIMKTDNSSTEKKVCPIIQMNNSFSIFIDIIDDYIAAEGITVNIFAQRANISSSDLYNWMESRLCPFIGGVIKIADFLDCSMDYLLGL